MEDRKYILPNNVEKYLQCAFAILSNEGQEECAGLIVNARASVNECVDYDNWDGGQDYHDLILHVPMNLYLSTRLNKKECEKKLAEVINEVSSPDAVNEHWRNVTIALAETPNNQWREDSGFLTTNVQRIVTDDAQNRIWKSGFPIRALISYRETHKKEVGQLAKELEFFGISAFAAHRDINNGTEWPTELVNALSTMDVIIPILTDDYRDSVWTDQEVGWAFGSGKKVIPVNVGKTPYGFMGSIQCNMMSWVKVPKYVFDQCQNHVMWIEALIKAVSLCPNFCTANDTLWSYVSNVKQLTRKQINDLVSVANANKQISCSISFAGQRQTGMPFIELLEKWSGAKWAFVDNEWKETNASSQMQDVPF